MLVERRREQALVARVAVAGRLRGESTSPSLERGVVDPARDAQLGRQEGLAVARVGVLDAEQVAVAAHLVDERDVRESRLELVAQARLRARARAR